MKTNILITVLLIAGIALFCITQSIAANFLPVATDTSSCLEIKGKVYVGDYDETNNYQVKLYSCNSKGDTALVSTGSSLDLFLNRNCNYIISISQAGYETKTISVLTRMPEEIHPSRIFTFSFEINLIELVTTTNPHDIEDDSVITAVFFSSEKGRFDYLKGAVNHKELANSNPK
jgi:hypothetical protein